MLIFGDALSKLREALRREFPEIDPENVDFDKSGHSDVTVKIFSLIRSSNMDTASVISRISTLARQLGFVTEVSGTGGYVNISIDPMWMLEAINREVEGTGRYPDIFQDPERVSVEHTSTNPTGPIHIGRARNSIIGDSIARLYARCGYRVTTQYFVNDSGKQVASLYAGYKKYCSAKKASIGELLEAYRSIYRDLEKDADTEKSIQKIIQLYESGDPDTISGIREVCSTMLDGIVSSLRSIGINIDDYTWESSFIRTGELSSIIESLDDYLRDDNGAKYIEVQGRKVYLTRSDGTSLYFSRDIAYHLYKANNFDVMVDILGEDHKDHAMILSHVLKDLMGVQQTIKFVFYSYVNLETGKMSTRKGNAVNLDDLLSRALMESKEIVKMKRPDLTGDKIDEIAHAVAVSAVRFNMVRLNSSKPITFKWSEALNFEGDSAPFIMYAYARASSILRKSGTEFKKEYSAPNKYEADLIKRIYMYPYVLQNALVNLRPEEIATYSLELVRTFNSFYLNCPVITSSDYERNLRINLVFAFRTVISDAANILGIRVLEEM
ncbi:MAG: arginine--tRNA ligase [Thermoplasmataceae archaeon]